MFDIAERKDTNEANAVIGAKAPSLYDGQDRIAAVLLASILGGPASNSLLNASLREKHGWVYAVECSYTQYRDSGIMAVMLGCDKENLEKCVREVRRIIALLCEKPVSDRKLAAAKKQLLGQLEIAGDNGETQCLSMGKSMLAFGKVDSDEVSHEKVMAVTADDVLRVARKIWDPAGVSCLRYV